VPVRSGVQTRLGKRCVSSPTHMQTASGSMIGRVEALRLVREHLGGFSIQRPTCCAKCRLFHAT
jgi:hypothetical protein